LAFFAESADMVCERYFCSSDPNSLDAIKAYNPKNGRSFFACDATAPHPRQFSTPGAVTHIADLSQFWSNQYLRERKDEIIRLQDQKAKYYKNAYAFIACAGNIMSEVYDLVTNNIDKEAMKKRAVSLIKRGRSDGGMVLLRPVNSISMMGRKRLDNKGFFAYKRIKAENICGSGYVFIKALADLASKNDISFDYKTALQQFVQASGKERLQYICIGESGPDHNKTFEVEAKLNSNVIGVGTGKTKREAEQHAAKKALELFAVK
jgi:hypothetical protein